MELLSFGQSDRVHGYNPAYRQDSGRFAAFELQPRTPGNFRNQRVSIVNSPDAILDHQGHIVPQSKMAPRFEEIARKVLDNLTTVDLAKFCDQITHDYPDLQFQYVNSYIDMLLAKNGTLKNTFFINGEEDDIEDKVGGYFSILNWNPVNIGRSPEDAKRGDYPKEKPDDQVADKLISDQDAPDITIPKIYAEFLIKHKDHLGDHIDDFISASNKCLALDNENNFNPVGYYKFDWKLEDSILKPNP